MNHKIDESQKNKRAYSTHTWILIGVLMTAGLFFRFYNLEKKFYWCDETFTSLYISGYMPAEVKQMVGDREISPRDLMRFQSVTPDRGLFSTMTALSVNDPHHSPFYYGLARLWAGLFGDSVWAIRSLSAFASLLVFPCLYWLCRELFEMRWVTWVALMIVAVSPFHVLYAQEARQYSLWTVAIVLSSAALLWALRVDMKRGWALYAATVAIGMYTHVLFGLVIIAHGIYIFANQVAEIGWKSPLQMTRMSILYVTATLAGLAAFMPWLYILVAHFETASNHMSWLSGNVNPFHLMGMWAHNFSAVFLDTNHTLKSVVPYDFGTLMLYGIRGFILIIAAYSTYFLYTQTPQRTWLFVLALIVIPLLMLAVSDFLLGGARSGWSPKYLLPSYLGIQLALAHLLATKMTAVSPFRRRGWQAVTASVIVCGIVSCAISSQAESWWMKPTLGRPQEARIINACVHPLLIIDVSSTHGSGNLFYFSRLLHPKVRLWVAVRPEALQVRDGFSDVFIYDPSLLLRQKLEQEEGFTIKTIGTPGRLWRVIKDP